MSYDKICAVRVLGAPFRRSLGNPWVPRTSETQVGAGPIAWWGGTPLAMPWGMDLTAFLSCADCPGFIEGIWAALATVALGVMATLLFAASAAADRARGRALAILVVGSAGTLFCARYAALGIWQLLDPAAVG